MSNKIKSYFKGLLIVIISLIFIIFLFIFKKFFSDYQYVAEWIATFSLLGLFMQFQWRHQDVHKQHLQEESLHKISIKVILNKGHINGIIGNSSSRPLAYVKDYSGKYVHDLYIHIMFPNMYRKTSKGFISVTSDGMSNGSTIHKPHHIYMSVPLWTYHCKYKIKDTMGDKESSTPILTNGQLFKIFNDNFYKNPGIYKFNVFFSCYRSEYSYRYNALVIYKYRNNISDCQVLKLSESK